MQLLKFKDVVAMTRISRSHLYRLIQEGRFPKQIRISRRSVAFDKSEVEAWLEAMKNGRA